MDNAKDVDFVDQLFQKAFSEPAPATPDFEQASLQCERISDNDLDFVVAAGGPYTFSRDAKEIDTEHSK